ncbi:MAG: phosphomannomutase [Epsilonproteobacteria bacterium]|nr:phosphomannomutase [Campylobacterota bacterium]
MIIDIQETKIDTRDITKLYPAAIVGTGYDNEVTHISLEWLESEGAGKVTVAGYAIVFHLTGDEKKEFYYSTRESFDEAIAMLKSQLNPK